MSSALFTISALFFIGALYNVLSLKKPGFFPPKRILKKRAEALAGGGAICFVLALIFTRF